MVNVDMAEKTKSTNRMRKLIREIKGLVGYSVLTLIIAGCATQQAEVKKVAAKKQQPQELSCEQIEAARKAAAENPPKSEVVDASKPNAKKAPKKPEYGIKYTRCLPRGVIEFTENFPIKPDVQAKFLKSVELLNDNKYDEAIMLLKGVVGQSDQFSAPYVNLGIAYARKKDYKNAEINLRKAREINPKHPIALNELGLVLRKTGHYKEARALYEELLHLYPDFLPGRKNLGVLCDIYIQDLDCALSQYQEYLLGKPDDEKVKIWVADVKSRIK